MALKGTIKDFGIADIFQLIGQQTKTGVLVLRHETDEVRVYFQSGSVVRAESSTRPQSQLLGRMMVEAELLTPQELQRALSEQARTLKKIGAVFTELDLASEADVRDFAHLQMTETVYALFTWDSGTYEFEQTESVPMDEGVEPIRAEGILLEGLRMIDEWPTVRARLPNLKILPEKLKPLPEPKATDDDFDVFGFEGEGSKAGVVKSEPDIGANERRVFGLIESGRDLQRLIHLSRLGEFETCRVILTLADGGFIRLVEPKPVEPPPPKWRPTTLLVARRGGGGPAGHRRGDGQRLRRPPGRPGRGHHAPLPTLGLRGLPGRDAARRAATRARRVPPGPRQLPRDAGRAGRVGHRAAARPPLPVHAGLLLSPRR
jgi:hypothetical protein